MSQKPAPSITSNPKLQYRLVNGRVNPSLILLNRQSILPSTIFNQILASRNNKNDNYCLYLHRHCLQNKLEGFDYCIRHILHDRNAPFKQCSYTLPQTSKRCPNAARRMDRRDISFCPWHIKKFNLLKRKNAQAQHVQQLQASKTTETALKRKFEELEHYCSSTEHDHKRRQVDWDLPDDKCVTATKSLKSQINDAIDELQVKSQNEEDFSSITLSEVLNVDNSESDNDCIESYMEDPLRHAGVYTAEEIAHISRDKMLRLQTLYINLLNYYRYLLKNKMRDMKVEHPKGISKSTTDLSLSELEDYKLFKAMKKYQNIWGIEKVIKDTSSEVRRSLVVPIIEKKVHTCIYAKDSEECKNRCVPLSNYCRNHILYDPLQVLYRPCANGSPPCLQPIISYVHKNGCVRHTQVKFEQTDITNILKSPIKEEHQEEEAPMPELENEPEDMFQGIEDMALGMDSAVPANLFALDQFDLDNPELLT